MLLQMFLSARPHSTLKMNAQWTNMFCDAVSKVNPVVKLSKFGQVWVAKPGRISVLVKVSVQ